VDLVLTNGGVRRIFTPRHATKPLENNFPALLCLWPDKSRISCRGRNPQSLTSAPSPMTGALVHVPGNAGVKGAGDIWKIALP
jgi:hypothetical protein